MGKSAGSGGHGDGGPDYHGGNSECAARSREHYLQPL